MYDSAVRATPRAFGCAGDLEFDFALASGAERVDLVTALLAACAGGGDASHWWAQPLGVRIAGLLKVLQLSIGGDSLELTLRCGHVACAEGFQVSLPWSELQAQPLAEPVVCQLAGAREVLLRPATGDDLRHWRSAGAASGEETLQLMIASLLLSGEADVDDQPALAEALAEQDPLVDFSLRCLCPACGMENALAIDLEARALSHLAALQRALLREVHVFATRYGWTESQVLALPAARRARYLEMIESG